MSSMDIANWQRKDIKDTENKIVNDIMDHYEVRVKHFYDRDAWSPQLGGFTVAYFQKKGDSFVTLATAVCSSKERYCRKVGKSLALANLLENRCITLPVPKWSTAPSTIQAYFGQY